MELTNQHQIMTKDKVVDRRPLQESNSKPKQAGLGVSKQQQQQQQSAATSPAAAASPPSSSSSPNHEFSFTISLHHSSSNPVLPSDHKTNNKSSTSTPPSSAFAIDLSPADDIFFHGHLLPLHLLSHLPTVSPRSSTNSMESFTLPIREMIDDDDDYDGYQKTNRKNCSTSDSNIIINNNKSVSTHQENNTKETRTKSKSFSLFKFSRRKKGFEDRELPEEEEEDNNRDMNKQKKRLRFDHVSHVIKKYMKMVRPLLFKRRENQNVHFNGQAYSFSGNLMSYRNKQDNQMMMRSGKRGEFSAPASIRTSPTNSGLLVATKTTSLSSSTSDSTMEELQAAIQAAIAHCKNSIAVEDKLKS